MEKRILYFLSILTILALSCTKHHAETEGQNQITFSVTDYNVSVVDVKSATEEVGASYLFETTDDFQNKGEKDGVKGHGGYFNVTVFHNDSKASYFTDSTTVRYHDDVNVGETASWRTYYPGTDFPDQSDKVDYSDRGYVSIYWPYDKNKKLDFIAYMPLKRPAVTGGLKRIEPELDPYTYISLADHDASKNPTFVCTGLPTDKAGQAQAKEFLYAYAPGQSYSGSEGQVGLNFKHAYAAVYIQIDWASGIINSFGFKDIYNNGILTVLPDTGVWTATGDKTDLIMDEVNHTIPGNIQPGDKYGPFLVLPQDVSENQTQLTITTTLKGETTSNSYNLFGDNYIGPSSWESGKKYVYALTLGSSEDNIKVNVYINEWDEIGDGQEIEIK